LRQIDVGDVRHVVALGGGGFGTPLDDYVLAASGKERPRICFVPTASGEDRDYVVSFYETFAGRAHPSHLTFFPWPRADLRDHVLAQDVILVGGGNTANMLAIWRTHDFDAVLREAWERGIVLAGQSAGAICWFEAGVTDSFGPQLEGMRDGLGFVPGSACPHYDVEELRRPAYRQLVEQGFPPGVALEDLVAAHFVGTELAEVVSARPGARAYRVAPSLETPLPARELEPARVASPG
jgi:dipeptidase E